jgi:hypothetical protein
VRHELEATITTLAEIADIGEILGGTGVFGPLIFVGLQVRQNTGPQ